MLYKHCSYISCPKKALVLVMISMSAWWPGVCLRERSWHLRQREPASSPPVVNSSDISDLLQCLKLSEYLPLALLRLTHSLSCEHVNTCSCVACFVFCSFWVCSNECGPRPGAYRGCFGGKINKKKSIKMASSLFTVRFNCCVVCTPGGPVDCDRRFAP